MWGPEERERREKVLEFRSKVKRAAVHGVETTNLVGEKPLVEVPAVQQRCGAAISEANPQQVQHAMQDEAMQVVGDGKLAAGDATTSAHSGRTPQVGGGDNGGGGYCPGC